MRFLDRKFEITSKFIEYYDYACERPVRATVDALGHPDEVVK